MSDERQREPVNVDWDAIGAGLIGIAGVLFLVLMLYLTGEIP